MEIEKRIKEIKELVESGRETQEGIAVPDNYQYEYILYELFEDKNIENGYADALIGFNREKMGEWKDIINKYNNAFLKSYRYFVYDKGNKRFMTVEEMEEKWGEGMSGNYYEIKERRRTREECRKRRR